MAPCSHSAGSYGPEYNNLNDVVMYETNGVITAVELSTDTSGQLSA